VGTQALKAGSGTNLWTRLWQHKGQATSGGGITVVPSSASS